MAGKGKVHFLTAYIEFLLDEGIKSEEYYLRRCQPVSPLPSCPG
jgi:hypothetical protein